MKDEPTRPDSANSVSAENGSKGQQALTFALFMLKVAAYLAGLAAFGFLIFWLRRSMGS
jgi:hypothetical protein